jgi:hypothetical protein
LLAFQPVDYNSVDRNPRFIRGKEARMARSAFRIALALAAVVLAAPLGRAQTETREFVILVNGKESGQSKVVIINTPDGKSYMKATVNVKVPGIIFPYSYTTDVQEWYQQDRLMHLVSSTVENGKKKEVAAKAEGERILVTVNGETRAINWDVWSASFWKLAERRFHNKDVPVLEPDTGRDMVGRLEYVGEDKQKIGGELEQCFHFRVSGIPAAADLWFDRHHRLVRQEFTESGQRTIVQLMSRKN